MPRGCREIKVHQKYPRKIKQNLIKILHKRATVKTLPILSLCAALAKLWYIRVYINNASETVLLRILWESKGKVLRVRG